MRLAKINPTLCLIIVLPLFAVVASVGTAVVAVSSGDSPLPDQYHWEGDKLDHDFAQSRRASELHLNATLNLQAQAGICRLTLRLDGIDPPPALDLTLIHVANPALDRNLRFSRVRGTSAYTAACTPLPDARWHVELSDPQHSWSFRAGMSGAARIINLSSNSPADDS